jgi:hypothetical protein
MAGLDPAIHALKAVKKDVDARVKPGHDERESCGLVLRGQTCSY